MNITQNPFSVYDFLGYLVPGVFFVVGIYIVLALPIPLGNLDFSSLVSNQNSIILLILCYLIGHIISYISSITIEKYSVWTLGYPSTYLFKKRRLGFWKSITSKYDKDHRTGSIARIFARIAMKSGISLLLFPIVILDIVVRHVFRLHDQYARSLDEDILCIVEKKIEMLIQEKFDKEICETQDNDKRDYFRLIYHHAIANATNHIPKMQNLGMQLTKVYTRYSMPIHVQLSGGPARI